MMNWLKKLTLFRLMMQTIYSKKLKMITDHDHSKYMTTQEFNKLAVDKQQN